MTAALKPLPPRKPPVVSLADEPIELGDDDLSHRPEMESQTRLRAAPPRIAPPPPPLPSLAVTEQPAAEFDDEVAALETSARKRKRRALVIGAILPLAIAGVIASQAANEKLRDKLGVMMHVAADAGTSVRLELERNEIELNEIRAELAAAEKAAEERKARVEEKGRTMR